MDSPMLKMLKTQNPNSVYPTNMGQLKKKIRCYKN